MRAQKSLHEYLQDHYGDNIARVVIRTGGRKTPDSEFTDDPEVSQRTRSFTFLTIAALAARRRGMSEIVVIAENGQMAIHLPLSAARIGAFSTHTAHPKFVAEAAEFFQAVLQYPIHIENPYVYKTKAEVVAKLASKHCEAIPLSISCWKSSRVGGGHCGQCVPCYVRRVALEFHGVKIDPWKRDIFEENVGALDATDEGKRNLSDLSRFTLNFRKMADAELDMEYCELFSQDFDRDRVVAMYRKFADESLQVFQRYPALQHLV